MKQRLMILTILLPWTLLPDAARSEDDVWTGVERIVAVGDVHGGYVQFVRVLGAARVIDRETNWIGGKTHLVQLGDIVDRGPHSRKVIDLLLSLAEQARAAGGHVHCLIGNHEAMRVSGDLTYTHRGEFAEFRTKDAGRKRAELFRRHVEELKTSGDPTTVDREYERRWYDRHPIDRFQFQQAMSPTGRYGKWMIGNNTIIRVNDVIFVHGGISPEYSSRKIREINDAVRKDLSSGAKRDGSISNDQLGPLWYRGLARGSSKRVTTGLDVFLAKNGAKRIVIAHTKSRGRIGVRLGGRVVQIDVESSKSGGPAACLLIEDGSYYEVSPRGKRRL